MCLIAGWYCQNLTIFYNIFHKTAIPQNIRKNWQMFVEKDNNLVITSGRAVLQGLIPGFHPVFGGGNAVMAPEYIGKIVAFRVAFTGTDDRNQLFYCYGHACEHRRSGSFLKKAVRRNAPLFMFYLPGLKLSFRPTERLNTR